MSTTPWNQGHRMSIKHTNKMLPLQFSLCVGHVAINWYWTTTNKNSISLTLGVDFKCFKGFSIKRVKLRGKIRHKYKPTLPHADYWSLKKTCEVKLQFHSCGLLVYEIIHFISTEFWCEMTKLSKCKIQNCVLKIPVWCSCHLLFHAMYLNVTKECCIFSEFICGSLFLEILRFFL